MSTARILNLLTPSCTTRSQADQILAQILARGLRFHITVARRFISACDALNLLNSVAFPLYINSITKPHTFVCNMLLEAFGHSETPQKSLTIYSHMHKNAISANHYTLQCVLKALTDLKMIAMGVSVHAQVIKLGFTNDVYVWNSLLNLYAASGDVLSLCTKVFDEMPLRDAAVPVSTFILSNHSTMSTAKILNLLMNSCKTTSHADQILAQILVQSLSSNTTVAHRFISACEALNLLSSVAFPLYINNNTKPHTFVCNILLKAFSHSGIPLKSQMIYTHMHKNAISMNNYTFSFVLKALADLKMIAQGVSVHAQVITLGFTSDVYVGNSVLNLYAASGDMSLCRKVFDKMPLRDVVSWTVVISGYKEAGRLDDAMIAFERMRSQGVMPNQVTAVNVLPACAGLGALDMGVWIHDQVRRNGWELDVILGTSLIDMYGKCGQIEEGMHVFKEMSEKNVFTWNAVIMGLALSKNGEEAIKWFYKMEEEGVQPDEVTLIAVLTACMHSGLVHIGRQIFSSLLDGIYGFKPSVKHYACIVNLLARSKCLDEAVKVIGAMPFEPTVSIWGSLLSGARANANFKLGELAAGKLVDLQSQNSAYYVALSNLYAEMGRWSEVEEVRTLMKDRELKKDMGSSIIELENPEHCLLVAV